MPHKPCRQSSGGKDQSALRRVAQRQPRCRVQNVAKMELRPVGQLQRVAPVARAAVETLVRAARSTLLAQQQHERAFLRRQPDRRPVQHHPQRCTPSELGCRNRRRLRLLVALRQSLGCGSGADGRIHQIPLRQIPVRRMRTQDWHTQPQLCRPYQGRCQPCLLLRSRKEKGTAGSRHHPAPGQGARGRTGSRTRTGRHTAAV